MTRRNTGILLSINPEIDRTYHRLVRQNRTIDTNFVSVSEHPVAENTASEHSVSVHSEYSDSVHSVAFPNFDHSVHSENMAQPPTPPGPRERTLRELAAPDFTYDSFLIEKMASNSQQFNARSGDAKVVRGVHDVGTNAVRQDKLETKIDSLTTLITQLAINQQKSSMARVCGICTSMMCPSLLKPRNGDHPEAMLPPHQQQHYDPPSSSTYNPGWRNQAPFQNNNVGQNRSSYVPPPIQQQRHQMINTPSPTEPSLEELVRQMTMQNMKFQQETRASIQRQDFCIDEFLNIDIDVPCTSLYTCHACTDSELCDSSIDEFLNIVVDSPVQAATKPSFATFFPSILNAPDWTPPFDLECDIVECKRLSVGDIFGTKNIFGHYKWKMCAKVKIGFLLLLPLAISVLLLPPWKARARFLSLKRENPAHFKNSTLTLSLKRGILAQARISQCQPTPNAISRPGETSLAQARILQYNPGFHPPS
ncbi:hypothetical protein Lal_00042333 [Lupinus albus]|nr:hypothetical protein Lal_00042333 [Lupinus albus]